MVGREGQAAETARVSRRQDYPFEIELEVRDYECDLQGVVNNAVYLNYLEHARHRYLLHAGLDFARLHEQGCDLVLMRAEVDYLAPLRSGDRFAVGSRLGRGGRVRWIFDQEIFRLPEGESVVRAHMEGTGVINGRPRLTPEVQALLDEAEEARP